MFLINILVWGIIKTAATIILKGCRRTIGLRLSQRIPSYLESLGVEMSFG
jgi:hypothetical protein